MRNLIFAFALIACGQPSQTTTTSSPTSALVAPDMGQSLGTVGGVPIDARLLQRAASLETPKDGREFTQDERNALMEATLRDELLFREAYERGLHLDPKVRKVMVSMLLQEEVFKKVQSSDFNEADLRAHYDAHRDKYTVPEKRQVKRILRVVEGKDPAAVRAELEEIRTRVMADPTTFRTEAVTHSEDPYRRRGGDLGYVQQRGRPGVDVITLDLAFDMEKGAFSEIYDTGTGLAFLYLADVRPGAERSFEQMKPAVLREMKNERFEQRIEELTSSLQTRYGVAVDQAAVNELPISSSKTPTALPKEGLPPSDPEAVELERALFEEAQ